MIGVMVPVKPPAPMKVSPVTNAWGSFGSRPASASILRTVNEDTPTASEGERLGRVDGIVRPVHDHVEHPVADGGKDDRGEVRIARARRELVADGHLRVDPDRDARAHTLDVEDEAVANEPTGRCPQMLSTTRRNAPAPMLDPFSDA